MRDAAALDVEYERVVGLGQGRTVFVAGDDDAGRRLLLQGWARALEDRGWPRVLGGTVEDGQYVPWSQDARSASDALAALDQILSLTGSAASLGQLVLPPFAGFLGQVIAKCQDALKLARAGASAWKAQQPATLLSRAVRELCARGPAVCIMETDESGMGGLWADLVKLLARRVARDLPLLLVIALDGPENLGVHQDGEPETLAVARSLSSQEVDVASWRWLAPLTVRDLHGWAGAEYNVLKALVEVTRGRSGWCAELWDDWQARGVVSDVPDGRWRFTATETPLDDVGEIVEERLGRCCGNDLERNERAWRLLACAALEGRRFTAPAIAAAWARDVDETIDFFDEVLLCDCEHPDGFVNDEGFDSVSDERGTRSLATYSFSRDLDWRLFRTYGLSDAERRHISPRLGYALETMYGGQASRVAGTLARLFTLADDQVRARHYRRMADIGINREVILWRARTVLTDEDPSDVAERARASQLLIAAAAELASGGRLMKGLRSLAPPRGSLS